VATTVHGRRAENLGQTMSGVGPDNAREFWTLSGRARLCLVGGLWKRDFLPKSDPFFSTLILEILGTKSDETWTQESPQHKEQVPKRDFPKSKDIPSDFG
jgi:hypothetical protein